MLIIHHEDRQYMMSTTGTIYVQLIHQHVQHRLLHVCEMCVRQHAVWMLDLFLHLHDCLSVAWNFHAMDSCCEPFRTNLNQPRKHSWRDYVCPSVYLIMLVCPFLRLAFDPWGSTLIPASHLLRACGSLTQRAQSTTVALQGCRSWPGRWQPTSWGKRPNNLRSGHTPWANLTVLCLICLRCTQLCHKYALLWSIMIIMCNDALPNAALFRLHSPNTGHSSTCNSCVHELCCLCSGNLFWTVNAARSSFCPGIVEQHCRVCLAIITLPGPCQDWDPLGCRGSHRSLVPGRQRRLVGLGGSQWSQAQTVSHWSIWSHGNW